MKVENLLPALAMLACFHRRLYTEANRFSGKKEVGHQRYMILHCLKLYPELSLKKLAQTLGVSTSGLSLIIDSLREEGLVVRKENPADRRQVVLALTTTGETLLEGIEGRMVDRLKKQTGRLKKDERLKFMEICRELAENYLPRFFSML
ncbi:MAG: MarR family transcriptional regulator [Firmicutes bacterium]|nr:MarR family transcriptional regulator [Bacillota bacterium]